MTIYDILMLVCGVLAFVNMLMGLWQYRQFKRTGSTHYRRTLWWHAYAGAVITAFMFVVMWVAP